MKHLKRTITKPHVIWLSSIFLFALAVRLFLTFQTSHFALDDSYFVYRQVDSILESGVPSFVDELSFSGRTHIFPPLYYYLLAGFALFLGKTLALKIIPNILASLLILIVYAIVVEITRNRRAALLSSFAAAFIPVFVSSSVVSAGAVSFVLPLTFYCCIVSCVSLRESI